MEQLRVDHAHCDDQIAVLTKNYTTTSAHEAELLYPHPHKLVQLQMCRARAYAVGSNFYHTSSPPVHTHVPCLSPFLPVLPDHRLKVKSMTRELEDYKNVFQKVTTRTFSGASCTLNFSHAAASHPLLCVCGVRAGATEAAGDSGGA